MGLTVGEHNDLWKAAFNTHIPKIDKRLGHIAVAMEIEGLYQAGILTKEAYAENMIRLINAGHIMTIKEYELTEAYKSKVKE